MSNSRRRSLIGRTPMGASRKGVATASAPAPAGAAATALDSDAPAAPSSADELEALSIDDFDDQAWFAGEEDEDDDEYEDDEYEDESEEDDAPPRLGIRLGANRAATVDAVDLDDTLDDDIAGIVNVVETYREENFNTENKRLDSEVMASDDIEVPFYATVESPLQSRPPAKPGPGDRALPLLAALTSTVGLAAGGVLALVGVIAAVSISSALNNPPPTDAEPIEQAAPLVAADEEDGSEAAEEPPDGDSEGVALDTGMVEEPAEEEEAAPKRRRRKPKPEPEPEPEPEPTPAPEPVQPEPTPEPEPVQEEKKKKKGLFGRKKGKK